MLAEIGEWKGVRIVWADEISNYDYYVPEGMRGQIEQAVTREYQAAWPEPDIGSRESSFTIELLENDEENSRQKILLRQNVGGALFAYVYEVRGSEVFPLRFGLTSRTGVLFGAIHGGAVLLLGCVLIEVASALVGVAVSRRRKRSDGREIVGQHTEKPVE
jgi:hypothetical protein